jgi:hypothetical protein
MPDPVFPKVKVHLLAIGRAALELPDRHPISNPTNHSLLGLAMWGREN